MTNLIAKVLKIEWPEPQFQFLIKCKTEFLNSFHNFLTWNVFVHWSGSSEQHYCLFCKSFLTYILNETVPGNTSKPESRTTETELRTVSWSSRKRAVVDSRENPSLATSTVRHIWQPGSCVRGQWIWVTGHVLPDTSGSWTVATRRSTTLWNGSKPEMLVKMTGHCWLSLTTASKRFALIFQEVYQNLVVVSMFGSKGLETLSLMKSEMMAISWTSSFFFQLSL